MRFTSLSFTLPQTPPPLQFCSQVPSPYNPTKRPVGSVTPDLGPFKHALRVRPNASTAPAQRGNPLVGPVGSSLLYSCQIYLPCPSICSCEFCLQCSSIYSCKIYLLSPDPDPGVMKGGKPNRMWRSWRAWRAPAETAPRMPPPSTTRARKALSRRLRGLLPSIRRALISSSTGCLNCSFRSATAASTSSYPMTVPV